VSMILSLLLVGAVGAGLLIAFSFLLSRFTREIFGRSLLAISLLIAAGAYLGFVIVASAGSTWILVELGQVVAFGSMALLGLRGSRYWLVAGWALHPLWDIGVHYFGPGHSYAPFEYAVACGSFDLVVAAYVAFAYGVAESRPLRAQNFQS